MKRRLAIVALALLACRSADRRSASAPPQDRAPEAAACAGGAMACGPSAPAPVMDASPEGSQDASPEPPYDLALDQQQRVGLARRELGPSVASTIVSDVFVVIGPAGRQDNHYERSVAVMKRSVKAYLSGRFGKKPARAISVYLFPESASYDAFCKQRYAAPCIAQYGFYQPDDRTMVMNIGLGVGTLTHELVHPLVEADFPEAPTWINEGIASLFEQPVFGGPGVIHGGKNWRHPRLVRALTSRERDQARLDRLFGMLDETFRGDGEDLHYATARYLCQWLDARGELWPFYQRWRDHFAEDPTGEHAFEEIVGMTPAEAHRAWVRWVLAL